MAKRQLMDERGNFLDQSTLDGQPASEADYAWSDAYRAGEAVQAGEEAVEDARFIDQITPQVGILSPSDFSGEFTQEFHAQEDVDELRRQYALSRIAARSAEGEDEEGRPLPGLPEGGSGVPLGAAPGQEDYLGDDAEGRASAAALGSEAENLRNLAAGYKGAGALKARQIAMQAASEREAMQVLSSQGEAAAREHMQRLAAAYDEADMDLASLRVDPQRWEESTPALAQVLMALASSAFSFFTGGQGPNPVVALIDRAIERDVQAQKANIDIRLKKAQTGLEKETALFHAENTLRASIWDRALNTYEQMLNAGALELDAFDHAAAYHELMSKAAEAHQKQYASSVANNEAKGKWEDPIIGREVVGGVQNIRDIGNMYSLWKGGRQSDTLGEGSFVGRVKGIAGAVGEATGTFNTTMNEYTKLRDAKILALAAEENRGRPTDKDYKAVLGTMPSPGVSGEAGTERMGRAISKYVSSLMDKYQSLSPSDQMKSGEAFRSAITEVSVVTASNPELLPYIKGPVGDALRKRFGQNGQR